MSGTEDLRTLRRALMVVPAAVALSLPVTLTLTASAALAEAVVATHGTPSPGTPDMGGMDMNMPGMDHGDMPGMDHGDSGHSHDGATGHDDMPGMQHDEGRAPSRPRAAVLGGFAAVNGAVLGSAAIVRRRTRGKPTGRRAQVQRRRSAARTKGGQR